MPQALRETFGAAYRDSSLETEMSSIAEQRQIFKGSDHAFLWKPKLRVPDIYESPSNQRAFGRFLDSYVCCANAEGLIGSIKKHDSSATRDWAPRPRTCFTFFTDAHATVEQGVVKGYNALCGAKVNLGSWTEYLAMREGILRA